MSVGQFRVAGLRDGGERFRRGFGCRGCQVAAAVDGGLRVVEQEDFALAGPELLQVGLQRFQVSAHGAAAEAAAFGKYRGVQRLKTLLKRAARAAGRVGGGAAGCTCDNCSGQYASAYASTNNACACACSQAGQSKQALAQLVLEQALAHLSRPVRA